MRCARALRLGLARLSPHKPPNGLANRHTGLMLGWRSRRCRRILGILAYRRLLPERRCLAPAHRGVTLIACCSGDEKLAIQVLESNQKIRAPYTDYPQFTQFTQGISLARVHRFRKLVVDHPNGWLARARAGVLSRVAVLSCTDNSCRWSRDPCEMPTPAPGTPTDPDIPTPPAARTTLRASSRWAAPG